MKKITVFIFLILMSCVTCGAFNPPNPERWELLTTTGSILCYFNRDSVQITEQPYGRSAEVWVTTYDLIIKIEAMMDWELNLDTKEFRLLTGNIYDEEGNELLATANPAEFEFIPPGSFIEDIYRELGGKETQEEAVTPAAPEEVKPEAPEAVPQEVPQAPAV